MKGLAAGAPWETCGRLGSVAATYALEHMGGSAHGYTWTRVQGAVRIAVRSAGDLTSAGSLGDRRCAPRVPSSSPPPLRRGRAGSRRPLRSRRPSRRGRRRGPRRSTYRAGAVICHQQDARSLHVRRRADAGLRALLRSVCRRCGGSAVRGGVGRRGAPAPAACRSRAGGARRWRARCRRSRRGRPSTSAASRCGGPWRAVLALPLGAALAAVVTLWAGGAAFEDTARRSGLHSTRWLHARHPSVPPAPRPRRRPRHPRPSRSRWSTCSAGSCPGGGHLWLGRTAKGVVVPRRCCR